MGGGPGFGGSRGLSRVPVALCVLRQRLSLWDKPVRGQEWRSGEDQQDERGVFHYAQSSLNPTARVPPSMV